MDNKFAQWCNSFQNNLADCPLPEFKAAGYALMKNYVSGQNKHVTSDACPELPTKAQLPTSAADGASPWLDAYIDYSRKFAPRAFDEFHEACGLWLLSTIAARRVVLHMGKPFYTPLYIALCARTSLYTKSTTADIAQETLRAAGLTFLLAADESTPQKFIADLALTLPNNWDDMTIEKQQETLRRLAFAGQRGWFYDEFGQHIDAMTRAGGYMREFASLLRRFDDCKQTYSTATISRGKIETERPYLALLASLTPADLKACSQRNAKFWRDGFFARFAFITPPEGDRNRGRFPTQQRIIPQAITQQLKDWHNRLGVNRVKIENIVNAEGKTTGMRAVFADVAQEKQCTLDNAVFEAFYNYQDAMSDLIETNTNRDLDGNYSRFAEKALRIAILLASLENDNNIQLKHWARGQEITERWRFGLHELYQQLNDHDPTLDAELEEKILQRIAHLGTATKRQVYVGIRGLDATATGKLLTALVNVGQVIETAEGKTKLYTLAG